jgi:hypothetical protein
MRLTRFVLCSMLVASFGTMTAGPATNVLLSDLAGTDRTDPGLRPGTLFSTHGLTVEVPQAGHGVWMDAVLADGGVQLGLETDRNGMVTVHESATTRGVQLVAAAVTDPCKDGAYNLSGVKWGTDFAWFYQSATTPSNFTASAAAGAFQRAVNHITGGYTNCGLTDNVGATNTYLGTTPVAANINNDGSCGLGDKANVVGFGALPKNYLGFTCWWTMNGVVFEADMRLNKAYYRFYVKKPSSCSSRFSIEAVATHEFGHAFGLAHVSETYHPSLTMSTALRPCQASESTLGLGDVRGLSALY